MANAAEAQIEARPRSEVTTSIEAGLHYVPQGNGFQAQLYLPPGATAAVPMLVSFHGATQGPQHTIQALREFADRSGVAVLAPRSRGRTWDVIEGGYGPDIEAVDASLRWVFARLDVDPARLAASGFSDGASYALSLAVANGDLFPQAIAWSPGFVSAPVEQGRPRIFISHGVRDQVLPIDRCSRRLVPRLRDAGYEVEYIEFDGPHTVPPELVDRALEWLLAG